MERKMRILGDCQDEWNEAYMRGGNIVFYPHEEIIRFVNKYVRKRDGIDTFHNIMNLTEAEWKDFKSLDLGCGIGRHIKFLDEFGLNPFGIDLSSTAISIGKEWLQKLGRENLSRRLTVGSVTNLPYKDETFTICVSCGTLDSMSREIALEGIQEAFRVMKENGLLYFDLILGSRDEDEIIEFGYEKDTVQSYFTVDSIIEVLKSKAEIVEFKIITWSDENNNEYNRRAHIIMRKK